MGRRLELTTTGAAVAKFAKELDLQLDELQSNLGQPSDNPLVLAAGTGSHRWITQGAVRHLLSRGRRLRLLTTDREETVESVRDGRATVGVTVLATRPRDLAIVDLASYPQVAVVPEGSSIATKREVVLSDLASSDLILSPRGRPQRDALDRVAKVNGYKLSPVAEAEGWDQMLHFVSIGVGACVVNGCVRIQQGMVARPIVDLPAVTYSALTKRKGERVLAADELLGALKASVP